MDHATGLNRNHTTGIPILFPRADEIKLQMLSVIRHVSHIEYFLERLQIGGEDPQRPHDIVGENNKFEWSVLKGMALQFRRNEPNYAGVIFPNYVLPSIDCHRSSQYHHQKWNGKAESSPQDALNLGAADAVCSLREALGREYQNGGMNYDDISLIAQSNHNSPIKTKYMLQLIEEMRKIQQPNLEVITALEKFPNIGISDESYDIIDGRVQETLWELEREYDYSIRR